MGQQAWTIVLRRNTWQLAKIEDEHIEFYESQPLNDAEQASHVEQMHKTMQGDGYRGEGVLLALDSPLCLSLCLVIPSARHARNRTAMGYLLEEHLPWAAEDTVVDYEASGTRAFFVAAERVRLLDLVATLEDQGIRVDSISPLARLALDEHVTSQGRKESRHVLAWGRESAIELWVLEANKPASWQYLPNSPEQLARSLRRIVLSEGLSAPIVVRDLNPSLMERLAADFELTVLEPAANPERSLEEAALRQAQLILAGSRVAAIEFRRHALAVTDRFRPLRRYLTTVQVAALLFLVAVGIAFLNRASNQAANLEAATDVQVRIFRNVFPSQPVPVGIRSRLEAEWKSLQASRGSTSTLPATVEVTDVLASLLKALPREQRFQLLEVRIDNGQLYVVGRVRGHGDADLLAAAIREQGLNIASPSTHQLQPQGVEFRVAGAMTNLAQTQTGKVR